MSESSEDAYKLPEGYGIKSKIVSVGVEKDKTPAIQVYLHTTRKKVHYDPYAHMYGGNRGPDSVIQTIYSDEPLKVSRPVTNLEDLSLVVGELIVEAIEHKGYEDRLENFRKDIKKWTEETGIKFG